MEENSIKCPECGAQKPTSRRMNAASADGTASSRVSKTGAGEAGRQARTRRANASRADVPPPPPSPRQSASMPPSGRRADRTQQAVKKATPPRMIQRHEYEAITPETQGYDHVNWLRLCVVAAVCVFILVVGIYFFLSKTGPGQRWLASNGRETTMQAYHELGREYMVDGAISRAVWALEIAQTKDPDNLEVLIDLGKAYKANGQLDRAELAYSRAIQHWPKYPDPYRYLIEILQDQNRNYEALQLTKMAMEENEDTYFSTLYTKLLPATPTVSQLGDRFSQPFELEISAEPGATIYYTVKGEDPLEKGREYTRPLYLTEGAWRVRAVAFKDGMYSDLQEQSYIINKPTPDMPKASLAPGRFSSPRNVYLRAAEDVIAIYYTTDGTTPTRESKVFSEDEPILLRIGKTKIRAIAENADNKLSNEMVVEYECDGRTKDSMGEKDTIADMKLYSTTRANFEKKYGAPDSEHPDGSDMLGTYTKLVYHFGYAVFLDRGGDREPVLAELSTNSTEFSGPRKTGIGTRMEDIVNVFRDEGGDTNANGGRLLYSLTSGRLGMLTKIDDNNYQVSYYCKLDNGQYIELTYVIANDLVVRIDWLRYDSTTIN